MIAIQNIVILLLMRAYEPEHGEKRMLTVFPAVLVGLAVGLGTPALSAAGVRALQVMSIPISNFSRLPQIWMNYKHKSTGELAVSTIFLTVAGNVARLFTTFVQVRDPVLFAASCSSLLLNATLLLQWYLYKTNT